MKRDPLPAHVLATRLIPNVSADMAKQLNLKPEHKSLALITADCDDVTYTALDEATKKADCEVVYAKSFYGGAANANTKLAGEIIGHWFPTKRGVAMGLCTAGYPLSAATTSAVAGMFVGTVGYSAYYIAIAVIAVIVGIVVIVFVRDFPEEKGGYPDNNPAFDGEKAKAEHQAALEYLKTSKWTALKCLKTGRMWVLWIAVGITGFMSMGIMSNFVTKFMVMGYELPTVLQMLGIAGVLAIPGSIVVGWLDVKIGTKKTGILINVLAFVAVLCCLTHVTVLHYISLPILAVMLGGSSNLMVSCTAAIWGRYDFKNAFSVIQPLNSVMTGVGITVVSACNSIDPTCQLAYIIMAVMAVIGLIAMCALKVEPIDKDVR